MFEEDIFRMLLFIKRYSNNHTKLIQIGWPKMHLDSKKSLQKFLLILKNLKGKSCELLQ